MALPTLFQFGPHDSVRGTAAAEKEWSWRMREIKIGDVTITTIVEREGPWRKPEIMFPAFDPVIGHRHLAELDPIVFDPVTGLVMSTYQTFVVRTPQHTILIDTCTGEDKGYPPPMDFPKKPWLDGFHALGLTFEAIDYVFCTHLHVDHTGWNTRLEGGRWVPTFPRAKYIFHRREYEFWEQNARAPAQAAHSPAIWRRTAGRSSRPVARSWSTRISRSTTHCSCRRRPVTRRITAASISARAGRKR